jgi:hypothetical protein
MDKLRKIIRSIIREELETSEKYIIYAYFCSKSDSRFRGYVDRFKKIRRNIDFWVEPSASVSGGFGIQSILNTNNKREANRIANLLYNAFDNDILIVLSKQRVSNFEPVGQNNDEVFVRPGRYFDGLVKKGEKGIYFV